MRLSKRLMRSRAAKALLCWLVARYVGLVYVTSRWRVIGREPADRLVADDKLFIAAFWHGRLLMAPPGWRTGRPMAVMISRHRDGELIARVVKHLGVETIRGSASKGGSTALRQCVRAIREGRYIGITPDGPRGPRMRAQMGIVVLARIAGVPIVPATYAVSRRKLVKSWDRFLIALPFSRGVYLWGAPIHVPRDADDDEMEACRRALEDALNKLTLEADRLVGVGPVEPAGAAYEEQTV